MGQQTVLQRCFPHALLTSHNVVHSGSFAVIPDDSLGLSSRHFMVTCFNPQRQAVTVSLVQSLHCPVWHISWQKCCLQCSSFPHVLLQVGIGSRHDSLGFSSSSASFLFPHGH